MELIMADPARLDDIQIDRVHGRAIRREIGERLRRELDDELGPAPLRLRALLERLAAGDFGAKHRNRPA
jgi:hypothetical protein